MKVKKTLKQRCIQTSENNVCIGISKEGDVQETDDTELEAEHNTTAC